MHRLGPDPTPRHARAHASGVLLFCTLVTLAAGCRSPSAGLRAELAAARVEIDTLRRELAAERGERKPSPELAEDLRLENRRLERLAGLTAKGERVASETARFRSAFDPATGTTTVLSGALAVDSDARIDLADHALAVGFQHPGERLQAADRPVPELIVLLETARNASVRLATTSAAVLRPNDASPAAEMPLVSYEVLRERSPARRGGRGQSTPGAATRDERLRFSLDRETARALARSNAATLDLPGLTLVLGRHHAALFRAALLRSE